MRGLNFRNGMAIVLLVALAAGAQWLIRKRNPARAPTDDVVALRPSAFQETAKPTEGEAKKTRAGGKAAKSEPHDGESEDAESDESSELADGDHEPRIQIDQAEALGEYTPLSREAQKEREVEEQEKYDEEPGKRRLPAALAGAKYIESGRGIDLKGPICSSIEYKGDGPSRTKVTAGEWGRVNTLYLESKAQLLGWLKKHAQEFTDNTVNLMQAQLTAVQLEKPPSEAEPDLAWRGIIAWTLGGKDQTVPTIRMGSGFVKLAVKHPERAKFEIARALIQSWAPCELQRISADEAWGPLLKCMGVEEANACGAGSYSDAGWAVSTVLASLIAPPDCTVPAFKTEQIASCAKKLPLPLSLAARAQGGPKVAGR